MGLPLPNQGRFKTEPPHSPHRMPNERPSAREDAHDAHSGSTHFDRIGERARHQGESHADLAQTVHNPIGGRFCHGSARSCASSAQHGVGASGSLPSLDQERPLRAGGRYPCTTASLTGRGRCPTVRLSRSDSPTASDRRIEDGRFTPSVQEPRQATDGASRTPVHRLSTEPHCVGPSRPSQISKSPAQRLKPATWSRKHNPEPTHYDAQTTSARSAGIPRSTETKNPRSKP